MAKKPVDPPRLPTGRDVITRIENVRKRLGVGKRKFAEDAGIAYRLYASWYTDDEEERKEPSRDSLVKIAEKYSVTLDELLGVATGQDPPYSAWREFLATKEGQSMSSDERRSLQIIRWLEGTEPEVWHYHHALAVLRSVPKKTG